MSGFGANTQRVGDDALRPYCSFAIEDELRNLQTCMQTCIDKAEQAVIVQKAVDKLNVPLSRENAATCAEIKRKYATFRSELQNFVDEQRKLQAETIEIQHRITRKRSDAWIEKNFTDVAIIADIIRDDELAEQDKTLRKELVLVLDHLISAVLLSPLTTQLTLQKMDTVLKRLAGRYGDIDEYIESSSELLTKKRPSYALQYEENTSNTDSNNIVDAAEEPRVKRQRAETVPALHSDFLVKVERTAAVVAAAEAAGSDATYEVFVSNLPWETTNEADVASYFGIAGAVVSVQIPTMADGSTVGVAVVRFASLEEMTAALRMDGYPFQGKNIHVAVHKSN
ncbi:unnamed protein product [Peronospora destructor]|uniref:RRM domain-containing protein n=1 Tax=Peronospora destructor TaxID=86335 RepID=A0AAV0UMF4_9STRA|nr:unnamed protein product [Peronospora destructor]